jgi:hypothetical protein
VHFVRYRSDFGAPGFAAGAICLVCPDPVGESGYFVFDGSLARGVRGGLAASVDGALSVGV